MADSVIELEVLDRIAVLTMHNERKLNALSPAQYRDLAHKMRLVAARDDVYVTVLTGTGRYFSAGADVTSISEFPAGDLVAADPAGARDALMRVFSTTNLDLTRAFYTHPKVLVVGLNGPAVGLSGALVALADFVYAAPAAFVMLPFSSLGLVAEGAASRALVQRIGPARANELLLLGRRMPAVEMVACGLANALLPDGPAPFLTRLLDLVRDQLLAPHLVLDSLLTIKKLLRQQEMDVLDRQNLAEVVAGVDRFMTGVPQEQFRKLVAGEKRHRL